eukprot:1796291-Amphidinium_carterae.3
MDDLRLEHPRVQDLMHHALCECPSSPFPLGEVTPAKCRAIQDAITEVCASRLKHLHRKSKSTS